MTNNDFYPELEEIDLNELDDLPLHVLQEGDIDDCNRTYISRMTGLQRMQYEDCGCSGDRIYAPAMTNLEIDPKAERVLWITRIWKLTRKDAYRMLNAMQALNLDRKAQDEMLRNASEDAEFISHLETLAKELDKVTDETPMDGSEADPEMKQYPPIKEFTYRRINNDDHMNVRLSNYYYHLKLKEIKSRTLRTRSEWMNAAIERLHSIWRLVDIRERIRYEDRWLLHNQPPKYRKLIRIIRGAGWQTLMRLRWKAREAKFRHRYNQRRVWSELNARKRYLEQLAEQHPIIVRLRKQIKTARTYSETFPILRAFNAQKRRLGQAEINAFWQAFKPKRDALLESIRWNEAEDRMLTTIRNARPGQKQRMFFILNELKRGGTDMIRHPDFFTIAFGEAKRLRA